MTHFVLELLSNSTELNLLSETKPCNSDVDLLQVAHLIRRKFKPLDTDKEGVDGLENQNEG